MKNHIIIKENTRHDPVVDCFMCKQFFQFASIYVEKYMLKDENFC